MRQTSFNTSESLVRPLVIVLVQSSRPFSVIIRIVWPRSHCRTLCGAVWSTFRLSRSAGRHSDPFLLRFYLNLIRSIVQFGHFRRQIQILYVYFSLDIRANCCAFAPLYPSVLVQARHYFWGVIELLRLLNQGPQQLSDFSHSCFQASSWCGRIEFNLQLYLSYLR